jgi:gliding motility-associated lipoprotein GldH
MRRIQILITALILTLLSACGGNELVFQEQHQFDKHGWNRFKEIYFNPEISDISKPYVVKLHLRLTDKYPYDYMQVQFSKESADGEGYIKMFSIPVKGLDGEFIVPAKDGIHEVKGVLTSQMYFNKPGTYKIGIKQIMPKFDTPGVESISLILEKRND